MAIDPPRGREPADKDIARVTGKRDTAKSAIAEDRMMPATTHVTRKQNKRFGHN